MSKALDSTATGRDDGTGVYMGAGGARWCIEESSGFKGSMVVSSVLNSTEIARMDHGNDTGTYLGTEAARQHILKSEHLSNRADGSNGTGDRADTSEEMAAARSTQRESKCGSLQKVSACHKTWQQIAR